MIMKKLFTFLKSVRLAIVLILIITIGSLLATLVPQKKEETFYLSQYSPIISRLIITTQFHMYFQSLLFLIPAALFFLNLGVCTVDRIYREIKGKVKERIGVDLIHLGILLLIVGAIVTSFARKEGFRYMGEGDQIALPNEQILRLESYEFHRYDDGRYQDWISVVDIEENGRIIVDSYSIEVNNPLKVGKIKVYQSSFAQELQVVLEDPEGHIIHLSPGKIIQSSDSVFRLREVVADEGDVQTGKAIFEKWENHSVTAVQETSISDLIGDFRIVGFGSRELTGLQFVIDPGYLPVIIALVMIGAGLTFVYIRKIGDKSL